MEKALSELSQDLPASPGSTGQDPKLLWPGQMSVWPCVCSSDAGCRLSPQLSVPNSFSFLHLPLAEWMDGKGSWPQVFVGKVCSGVGWGGTLIHSWDEALGLKFPMLPWEMILLEMIASLGLLPMQPDLILNEDGFHGRWCMPPPVVASSVW